MRTSFFVIVGLCLSATAARAQITKSGSGYLMRVKYSKGQVVKYSSVTTIKGATADTGNAAPLRVSLPIIINILSITSGKAKAQLVMGPATMGGSQVAPAQKAEMTLDTRNQASNSSASTLLAPLPQKPVKPGDKWSAAAPVPGMFGKQDGKLLATYKFGGIKTVDKRSVAIITYSISGSAGGSGMLMLLTKDGTLYRNSASLKFAGPSGSINASTVISRQ
jgi:hypothetical protein